MLYIGGAISSGSTHSSSVRSSWLRDMRRSPSAKRPSISHASAIITAPVVVMVSDTVWMRDGRLSSRTPNVGSCTTGRAPAPSAPMAISTVPVAPNSRVRRSATTSASLSGDPTVRSSPCQRAIDELRDRGGLPSEQRSRHRYGARHPKGTLARPVPEFRHNGVVKFRPDTDRHTRGAIVQLLLESGPITAGEIGDRLGISAAGVRRHLDALIDAGDAQSSAAAAWQHNGRGRPAKRYRLTAQGRAKLDHTYDDLAVAAMRQLREIGGDDAVRTFARRRIDSILSGVTDGPHDVESTADRVAAALTKAGYATTTTPVSGPVHGIQICQHHCPVSHVAEEFPELCETEREAFAEILGTHVQRLATIVNGDCACTTHVPLTETSTDKPTTLRRTARAEAATTKQGAST